MYEMLLKNTSGGGYIPPNIMIMQITPSSTARTMGMTITNVLLKTTYDVAGTSSFTGGNNSSTILVPIPANATLVFLEIKVVAGISVPVIYTTTNSAIVEGIVGWGNMNSTLNIRLQGCSNLSFVPQVGPTWSNWTNLFGSCLIFNQDISMWDTSHVTTMRGMFNSARAFDGWINDWDVGNVTDMSSMFAGNRVFNQPLNNWNTRSLTNVNSMMYAANSPNPYFNQSIANWDVSKITDMRFMLGGCTVYDRDLSGLTFPLVTSAMRVNYDSNTPAWPANRKPTFAL